MPSQKIQTLLSGKLIMSTTIIAMSETTRQKSSLAIKRLTQQQKNTEFTKDYDISIHQYIGSSAKGLAKLKLESVIKLQRPITLPAEITYDILWNASIFFQSASKPTLNWSGFMQDLTSGQAPTEKASITFLPIIDLNPTDEHCIYSTLLFINSQAKQMNVVISCVTFDQPLWLKATGIIAETNLNIVARLGGFHTIMSFLGGIGKIMKESGLEELFAMVYAELSVEHMMSGKAVSRALHAHFLVESSLMILSNHFI